MTIARIALLAGFVLAGTAAEAAAQRGIPLAPPSGPVDPYPVDEAGPPGGPDQPGPGRMGPGRMGPGAMGPGRMGPGRMGPGHMGRNHAIPPRMRRALLRRFDRNRDGRLTGRERVAARRFVARARQERMLRRLARFDANHDGWLDPAEQRAARDAMRHRRHQRRAHRADRGPGRAGPGHRDRAERFDRRAPRRDRFDRPGPGPSPDGPWFDDDQPDGPWFDDLGDTR